MFPMMNMMQQVQRIAQQAGNPQQLLQQFLPNVPEEIRSDPNQIINWMRENGMITEQQIRMARQMMGSRF